jgi:hypothetical protein
MTLFIDNKYTRWYFDIIQNAQSRTLDSAIYTEDHHIIPRSFFKDRLEGNPDIPENLVTLTAREHFICHWLLTKMTTGVYRQKMTAACLLMTSRYSYKSGRSYQRIKETIINSLRGVPRPEVGDKVSEGLHNYYNNLTNDQWNDKRSSSKKGARARVERGNHHWLTRSDGSSIQQDKVKNGTHHFLTKPDGSSQGRNNVLNGVCKFVGPDAPSQQQWTCEHCGKSGKGQGNYTKWHKNGICKTNNKPTHLVDEWHCHHCNQSGRGSTNYKRWHGDNCTNNPLSPRYIKAINT